MTGPSLAAGVADHHLLAVWNPAYDRDAIPSHVGLLLDRARRLRAGELEEEDDVYVWWGKIASPRRRQPLPHLHEILRLDEGLADPAGRRELHLYLTDYRSLYVAHVGEVTADDVRKDDGDSVPESYKRDDVRCDFWFRLFDVRRLVTDDLEAVTAELAKLKNVRYHDSSVSIYGGMIELPLIVKRPDAVRWFSPQTRELLLGRDRFWVEHDAESTGTGATERDLRENRFGDELWFALEPSARSFIATAENLFRTHRADAGFDFSGVVVNLGKAYEVQVSALLSRALDGATLPARTVNVDGRGRDVVTEGPFGLGALARILDDHPELRAVVTRKVTNSPWVIDRLPGVLRELSEFRNPAAHVRRVPLSEAAAIRAEHLGVGCVGALVELARARVV